jgi:hypothetical protein
MLLGVQIVPCKAKHLACVRKREWRTTRALQRCAQTERAVARQRVPSCGDVVG